MTTDRTEAERRLDEALLREMAARSASEVAESTLRAVVDASPLAIVSLDVDGYIRSWNASAERIFGWTASEVIGRRSPTVPADERHESDSVLRDVLAGKVVTGLHRRRLRKDGTNIIISVSTAPFRDETGEVVGTVLVAEDVTAHERAEYERNLSLAREREARSRAEDTAQRISRLQCISEALSEALTPGEVADVILSQGMETLGASAASISRIVPDENVLEIVASTGYPDNVVRDFARFPLDTPFPLSESVRTGQPIWIESPSQWEAQFPSLKAARAGLPMNASASIPLLVKGAALGALGLSFPEVRTFTPEDQSFALSLAQQCAQALERSRLYEAERAARAEAETARQRFEFLAQASITLSSSLDYATTLASVARLAVPHIADWCSVYIVDEAGSARLLAVAHVDPAKVALARALNERFPFDPEAPTGVAYVLRTSQPEFIPFIPDELLAEVTQDPELLQTLRELGLVSAMTVPLMARGKVLGAITLVSAESEHRYGEADLALASDLAGRAAVAVDNALLLRETQKGALEREAILGQIADGIVIADADGTVTFSNAVAQSLLATSGLGTPPQAYAETFHTFKPNGEQFPSEELPLARAILANETIVNEDVVIRHPGGPELIIECSATPVIGEDGIKLGGVVSFRDVTMQRTLERQKDDFLSAAAHDLKTPLTTIKGLAQILGKRAARADTPETNSLLDGLRRIDATTTRMAGLINELLDISRIQMGRSLDLVRSPTDLVVLLQQVATEQQHTTERHEVVVATLVPQLVGEWDAVRLERAFTNVVSNAITYSPDGGEVRITLAQDGSCSPEAVVLVEDHGLGIPEVDLPHIFDRFHRGSNVEGRIPGTGIGLAGAREIIEQHGGRITARRRESGGTSFEFRLPLTSGGSLDPIPAEYVGPDV
jgi:PAS domain S-box-containing protein